MWSSTVVWCAVVTSAMAAMFIAPLEQKPEQFEHMSGCYVSDLGAVLPVGRSAHSSGQCALYRCEEDEIVVTTCPATGASPSCHLVQDDNMPYPHCCPKCAQRDLGDWTQFV